MNTTQEQLNEIRERQLQADLETMGDPDGFQAPYFVGLFAVFASSDLPTPWNAIVGVAAIVGLVLTLSWKIKSRGAAPSKQYTRAIMPATAVFTFLSLLFAGGVSIALRMMDVSFAGTIAGAAYCVFAFVGIKVVNGIAANRLKAQR